MIAITPELVKAATDFANWLTCLPQRLVESVMGTQEAWYNRKVRVQKAKDLAELAEIAKIIQDLYWFKGPILVWANRLQTQKWTEDVEQVRDLFSSVVASLDELHSVLQETPLTDLALGAEVNLQISKARATYSALRDTPDEALLEDRNLIDILSNMEEMIESGRYLLSVIEHYRATLDSQRGDQK
jgi:hypothetical protein